MKDKTRNYKLAICTPCPFCGVYGGYLVARGCIRQDGNHLKWPCGTKQVLQGEDWITVKQCKGKKR